MNKKKDTPLVSIIIPAYNFGRYLMRALNSVRDQTYDNLEICLTNDGSTDNTDEVVNKFREANPNIPFSYVTQANQGLSAARNAAAGRSCGEYLCFLDADDALKPYCVSILMKYKNLYPAADIVSGGCECLVFDEGERLSSRLLICKKEVVFIPARQAFTRLFYQNMMGMISILITKNIFNRTGGFNENIRTSEDREFFIRSTRLNASVLLIPEILGVVYKYTSGLSRQPGEVFRSVKKTFKENKGYLLLEYPEEGRTIYRKAMGLRHLLVFGLYRSSSDPLRYFKMLGHLFGVILNMPSLVFNSRMRKKVTAEHSNFKNIVPGTYDGHEEN